MWIQELFLKGFRLFNERNFVFQSDMNYFIGPNARGKTTVLEAIFLLICGRSPRTQTLSEAAALGGQTFTIEAVFEKWNLPQHLKLKFDGERLLIFHNYARCKGIVDIIGLLQGVFTSPSDVQLVKGAPVLRRRFLNVLLSQADPLYVHHLVRYQRALAQRNALLKRNQASTLDLWEKEMSRSGAYLTEKREEGLRALTANASLLLNKITGGCEELSLAFMSKIPLGPSHQMQAAYEALFKKSRKLELIRGHTLYGPHKEDWVPKINGIPLKAFGSEGQMISFIYALKFAEWTLLKERSGEPPLLLLDDFGMGLDIKRREKVIEAFNNQGQTFITAASHPIIEDKTVQFI